MNQQQRQLISSFIKRYSNDNGTEGLLDYVAGTNGLLGACKELFDISGAVEHTLVDWFYQECSRYSVAPNSFADVATQILAIFNGNYESQDHYATLGLTANANADEVKSAYRKLSLQHHPDRALNNETYDPKIFININKAYRAITEPEKFNIQNSFPESKPEWNATKKRTISVNHKKKLIYWGTGMVTVLLVMIVVGSINVRKRAMLAGLTENRGAFVPPQEEVVHEILEKIVGRNVVDLAKDEYIAPKQRVQTEPMGKVFKEVVKSTTPVEEDGDVTTVENISKAWPKSLSKHNEVTSELKKEQVDELESDQKTVGDSAIVKKKYTKEDRQLLLQTPLQEDDTIQPDSIELQSYDLPIEIAGQEQPEAEPVVQNETINIQVQTGAKIEAPEIEKMLTDKASDDNNGNIQSIESEHVQENNIVEYEGQQVQIDQFFTEYQKAYAERNIISFSRYFSSDAIENDKPFAEMIPVYIDLFNLTSDVSLKINVLFWQNLKKNVQVEGRFNVNLKYKKGRVSNGVGTISFLLRQEEGVYKITSLAYEFD